MTSKNEYWSAVRAKFNELIVDFKSRCEKSIEPEYLYDIRLGEIQELWSWSNWIVGYNGNEPVYDGGRLRYAYEELVAGRRDYDDPEHLELDAYLQFEKWLNRDPSYLSNAAVKSQKPTIMTSSASIQENQSLEALVSAVENAFSADERGKSLEKLVSSLFETIPGLQVRNRVRTQTEEIDIYLLNNSDIFPFKKEDSLVLAECKNWTSKCGRDEFTLFRGKIENRNRCSLGFLFSWNGFTETVNKEMLRGSRERILIVPVIGQDIRAAVHDNNFADTLLSCWEKAVAI
ncbi:MAG: hypothetical protein F6K28_05200 [Microcoleus sp. SIO2G3]|nr:hypothetical protein [Microcoleus sp. SIO2G3]